MALFMVLEYAIELLHFPICFFAYVSFLFFKVDDVKCGYIKSTLATYERV